MKGPKPLSTSITQATFRGHTVGNLTQLSRAHCWKIYAASGGTLLDILRYSIDCKSVSLFFVLLILYNTVKIQVIVWIFYKLGKELLNKMFVNLKRIHTNIIIDKELLYIKCLGIEKQSTDVLKLIKNFFYPQKR